jgi:hypothetical protein
MADTISAFVLVHKDEHCEIYEQEELEIELEVDEQDIACAEPARDARPSVRVAYDRLNEFLGEYLKTIRRGEPMVVPAPDGLDDGDLLDVEIAITDLERFVLHAQVLQKMPLEERALAEVEFVAGPLTDRIVRPMVERALGVRLAARVLKS